MKWHVIFSTGPYDGDLYEVFDGMEDVLALLDSHASNENFTFRVIHGDEVYFEPSVTVKSFKMKSE